SDAVGRQGPVAPRRDRARTRAAPERPDLGGGPIAALPRWGPGLQLADQPETRHRAAMHAVGRQGPVAPRRDRARTRAAPERPDLGGGPHCGFAAMGGGAGTAPPTNSGSVPGAGEGAGGEGAL